MQEFITKLDGDIDSLDTIATVQHEGFTIECLILLDEDPDMSHYGYFSENPKGEFYIKHNGTLRSYSYFNAENVENMEQAQENYRRASTYGEKWFSYGARVLVSKKNIMLASNDLWGIESDSGDDYFIECFNDLIPEALVAAKKTLADLCSC